MGTMFEWTERGPSLIVNHRGERIDLADGQSVDFDDFVGAKVRVTRSHKLLTCEASLPESTGIMRWDFECGDSGVTPISATGPMPPVRNLAALISECRVGLNGRL